MKRKTIVLLSSVMAGALLVGGVFAVNYAITDNALPIGANVTPGDLDVDDTTYATLTWGETTALNDVGNIKVGENRKVGVVSLRSTVNYEGILKVSIKDVTTSKTTTDPYLLDYVNVNVFRGDLDLNEGALPTSPEASLKILKSDSRDSGDVVRKTKSTEVVGNPAGAEYSVFVTLDSSASPIFEKIENDKILLEVDWNPKSDDELKESTVYYVNSNNWENVYMFTWNGSATNAAFPGVKMVKAYDNVYRLAAPVGTMKNVIFSNGPAGEEGHAQTADLDFAPAAPATAYNASTAPCWDGTKWTTAPDQTVAEVVTATLNNEPTTINDIKGEDSTDRAVYRLTLAVGDKVAFKSGATDIVFYEHDESVEGDDKEVSKGTVFTATVAGAHTFYYNSLGRMYVGQPEAAKVYKLVGDHIGEDPYWSYADSTLILVRDAQDENHYTVEYTAVAGEKIKVTDGGSGWYGNTSVWDNCGFTVDGEQNVSITNAGTYTINFYLNSGEGNHIVPVVKA